MIIRITQEAFSTALSRTQAVIDRKSTRPILEHVLLRAFDGELQISATDLRASLTQTLSVEIETPGSVAIAGRKLFEIVRELPKGEIRLEVKENLWITISAGKSEFHLPGCSPDEFPSFPEAPDSFLSFSTSTFRTMLEKTLFASSNDESRLYLCGVYILSCIDDRGSQVLRMVATDGHRLSLIDRPIDTPMEMFDNGVILPKKGLNELRNLLDTEDETFQLGANAGQVFVRFDKVDMALTLIDGNFPNYAQVIPKESTTPLELPRERFANALKRVSLLSDQDTHSVILETTGTDVILSAMNPQIGDARETLEAPYEGSTIRVAFNAAYFAEALKSISGESVYLFVGEPLSPCLVKSSHDPHYLCVVMPMRID